MDAHSASASKDNGVEAPAESGLGECNRWREYLLAESAAYRELERERAEGWRSESLDWWYRRRQQQQQEKRPERNGTDGVPVGAAGGGATSFADSDIEKLCERYCVHAGDILTNAAPDFFSVAPRARKQQHENGGPSAPPTFLDLGCAPGGVSKYLVTKLQWHGVGVSLPVNRGGIALDVSWLSSPPASARYEFVEGSITEDDWHAAVAGRRFFFINGGAVQDHGQREGEAPHDTDSAAGASCVLPWFNFLVPQLRLAAEHVEDGGAVMLVLGVPQCASLPILLMLLRPLVRGGVHIMETMHLTKSPVYVLLTGVRATHDAAARTAWNDVLQTMTQGTRAFWRGETDDGLRLAKAGFEQHRSDLEAVWRKASAFLRRRRLYAERAMAASTSRERLKKRSRAEE
ncbi:hypothetical protein DQ04_05181040 [Trypanosoma grayi]|uniref:hypothetical protein n=1 Tax=Trypanosoma grayi TaxID=71804 RepID=UPI0004F43B85|nr:hypothetical protein DQ04_05181040 [Trypanosoma grayi]KEG09463.1 hypothetical protein DQ04_05181040 [Trypanosoma grayi]